MLLLRRPSTAGLQRQRLFCNTTFWNAMFDTALLYADCQLLRFRSCAEIIAISLPSRHALMDSRAASYSSPLIAGGIRARVSIFTDAIIGG